MNLFSASFPFPLHSVLIWQDGSLLEESYYEPCRREDLHRMFSVTKSFAALSIGGLIAEGKLALSGRIIDYFPEYVPEDPHPYLASMTIGDMLTMRTCHKATTYKINMADTGRARFLSTTPPRPTRWRRLSKSSPARAFSGIYGRFSRRNFIFRRMPPFLRTPSGRSLAARAFSPAPPTSSKSENSSSPASPAHGRRTTPPSPPTRTASMSAGLPI